MNDKPTPGRIVRYVLAASPDNASLLIVRPAMIVTVTLAAPGRQATVSLQVCTDGEDDRAVLLATDHAGYGQPVPPMVWRTKVQYSKEPSVGSWHWPPRDG